MPPWVCPARKRASLVMLLATQVGCGSEVAAPCLADTAAAGTGDAWALSLPAWRSSGPAPSLELSGDSIVVAASLLEGVRRSDVTERCDAPPRATGVDVVGLDRGGRVRWRHWLQGGSVGVPQMKAAADGHLYTVQHLGTPDTGGETLRIVRFTSAGEVAASRELEFQGTLGQLIGWPLSISPEGRLAMISVNGTIPELGLAPSAADLGDTRLLTVSPTLDEIEARAFPSDDEPGCLGGIVWTRQGDLLVRYRPTCDPDAADNVPRVARVAPSGAILWDVEGLPWGQPQVETDGEKLIVAGVELARLDLADGSLDWSVPIAEGYVVSDLEVRDGVVWGVGHFNPESPGFGSLDGWRASWQEANGVLLEESRRNDPAFNFLSAIELDEEARFEAWRGFDRPLGPLGVLGEEAAAGVVVTRQPR